MEVSKQIREILESLNGEFTNDLNHQKRIDDSIDQALQAIKKVVEGKKRGRGYYPATLGGGYEKAGYNQAIDDIAQLFEVMK